MKLKYYIFLIILLFTVKLFAQEEQDSGQVQETRKIFVSNNFENPEEIAIHIKWFSTLLIPDSGYFLFRKEVNTNNWEKIAHVKVSQDTTKQYNLSELEQKIWEAARKTSFEANAKDGLLMALTAMSAIKDNQFARLIGIYYVDKSVEQGKTYQYKVTYAKNGEEIVSSQAITAQKYTPFEPPKDIRFKRKRRKIKFVWKPEEDRYWGVNFYRWTEENSEPLKQNQSLIGVKKDDKGNYEKYFYQENLHKDTAYFYELRAVDYFGQESRASQIINVPIKDFDAPQAPENIKYKVDTLQVHLWWQNVKNEEDVAGINVYRSLFDDSGFEKVNKEILQPSDTSFTDKVPKPDEYYYKIAKIDTAGNEGISLAKFVKVYDVVAPDIPKGLKAVADTGKIKLSWRANTEDDLAGYILYKSIAGAGEFYIINQNPLKDTVYTDILPKNVRNVFEYKIAAQDTTYNRSPASKKVLAQMPDVVPPQQPFIKLIKADSTNRYNIIIWLKNSDTDLGEYILVRREKESGKDTILSAKISKEDTAFLDKQALANVAYYYYLAARDTNKNLSAYSEPYLFKRVDKTAGMRIKKFTLKYKKRDKQVQLKWQTITGAQYAGMLIYRSENNGKNSPLSGKLTTETQFTDKNIKQGNTYNYQLRLYDRLGNIVKSEIKSIKIK